MSKSRLAELMLMITISAVGTSAQNASLKAHPDNPNSKVETAKDSTAASSSAVNMAIKPATDDPNYIIGPEDELIVSVWKEPEISRAVPVRPDGKISLALLNDVQAAGLTPMQLGAAVTERLQKFISEPQVTVIVGKINSQRIFVVGEVGRTGAYTLLPNMTVMDALSTAGGFTPFAKRTKIYILRKQDGKVNSIPFNYKEAIRGRRPEQDIPLKPGDRIVVP